MRDYDVRLAVRELLADDHAGDPDTRIVEEMGIWNGAVRVDVAVINGELAGYEIKSARDTLSRLPAQSSLYNTVFDRVFLVAAARHIENARASIPTWWGIIEARLVGDDVELETVRCGDCNPAPDPVQLARLLWRDEAVAVLERRGVARGLKRANRETIAQKLAAAMGLDELRHEVRTALKQRGAWLGQPVNHQGNVAVCGEA